MEPDSDAAHKIKDVLQDIEAGVVSAYEGFKKVRWIADVYMVWAEVEGVVPDLKSKESHLLEVNSTVS